MFTEVLGVIIIIGVLIILLLRHSTGKTPDNINAIDENIGPATKQLQRELERTGNKILSQIDEKMTQLEQTVNEADEKIIQLKNYYAMLAEEENKKALTIQPESSELEQQSNTGDFNSLLHTAAKNKYGGTIDISSSSTDFMPPPAQRSNEETESLQEKKAREQDLSQTARRIFSLLNEGISPAEIGRQLSLGRGAVDMIVQMYNKR